MRPVHPKTLRFAIAAVALLSSARAGVRAAGDTTKWVGSWATSQQIPEPANSLPFDDMRDMTIRQIVHLSIGGAQIRVHISNAFGTQPLHFTAVHVARPVSASSAAIKTGSDRALTFAGKSDVIVPAGTEYVSDPLDYTVEPISNVAITFHLDEPPEVETGHPGSRSISYYVHGDQVSAGDLPNAKRVEHWYNIAGIDVSAPANGAAIVALGDSITDGHATTTNGNDRWTDVLAARLQFGAATRRISVLNQGIGGNHLLTDGLGPNALARFDRDILAQTGVQYLIVFEGVNDLGDLTRLAPATAEVHAQLVQRIIAAYQQMIVRAHAKGIKAIGATITPYAGSAYYHPDASNENDRRAVNEWIRAAGHFDGVIDFDKTVRDPQQPVRLLPAYDCGDHLHPSLAGYEAMAESVPLSLFTH